MTTFKKGDKFIPYKPKENNKGLIWNLEMDKYNGRTLIIECVSDFTGFIEAEGYLFLPDWCEKVEEIPNNHIPDIGKTIDWEQRRYELLKDFTSAQISGFISAQVGWSFERTIEDSVLWADEMIKQLKAE